MGLSGWHLLILALVALLFFGGGGRISSIMGDMAKGIKSFKKGLSEDDEDERPEARPGRSARHRSAPPSSRPNATPPRRAERRRGAHDAAAAPRAA